MQVPSANRLEVISADLGLGILLVAFEVLTLAWSAIINAGLSFGRTASM